VTTWWRFNASIFNQIRNDTVAILRVSSTPESPSYRSKGKPLVVLQVNCRSIYNKALEFWNLVDICNPDVFIGTESWLKGDTGNAEVFRSDLTAFRRDRPARGGGGFHLY
jgi:hypothetical protein